MYQGSDTLYFINNEMYQGPDTSSHADLSSKYDEYYLYQVADTLYYTLDTLNIHRCQANVQQYLFTNTYR